MTLAQILGYLRPARDVPARYRPVTVERVVTECHVYPFPCPLDPERMGWWPR